MAQFRIEAGKLAVVLKQDGAARSAAMERGKRKAIARGTTRLMERTPVDQGIMRNSWAGGDNAIVNFAPHAGIVEAGARPHKVNAEGIQALYEWVIRHGLVTTLKGPGRGRQGPARLIRHTRMSAFSDGSALAKQAMGIAWAIAKKLEQHGQKATYFVRNSLPELNNILKDCIDAELVLANGVRI